MPKNEETRKRILEVALKLFATNDFHKVNMRTIASAANIGLATIYGYFEGKESLLQSAIDFSFDRYGDELEKHLSGVTGAESRLRSIVHSGLRFFDTQPDLGSVLFLAVPFRVWAGHGLFRRRDKVYQLVAETVIEGQHDGEIRSEVSTVTVFDTIMGLIGRQASVSSVRGDKRPLTDYADTLCDIVCRAFLVQATAGSILIKEPSAATS